MEVRFNSQTPEHSVLSNFDPTPFTFRLKIGTFRFANAEAAFQVCKLMPMTLEDVERFRILTPKQARDLGRKVPMRPDWNDARKYAMEHVLREKFSNPILAKKLMEYPAGTTFVHEAPWDSTWGTGKDGKGSDWLGKLLTQLHKDLQPY